MKQKLRGSDALDNINDVYLAFDIASRLVELLPGGLANKQDYQRLIAMLYGILDFNAVVFWREEKIEAQAGDIQITLDNHTKFSSAKVGISKGLDHLGTIAFYKLPQYSVSDVEKTIVGGIGHLISTQLTFNSKDYYASLRSKAELKALQAQINPHFLFNALNTISSMCRIEPLKARELLLKLSNYFRATIETSPDLVDINKEISTVKCYLDIEKARFGDNFNVQINVPLDTHLKVPPLILQPLVENAIKHGLVGKQGGLIIIDVVRHTRSYEIRIADNGCGMEPDIIDKLLNEKQEEKRIGIYNVNQRLKEIYGEENGLVIHSQPGEGTEAIITIPVRERTHRDAIKGYYSR